MNCPGCGKSITEHEKFCGLCGYDLSEIKHGKKYCAQCGHELSETDVFCGYCGMSCNIDNTYQEKKDEEEKNVNCKAAKKHSVNKSISLVVLIIVLFILTGIGVLAVFLFTNEDNAIKQALHFSVGDTDNKNERNSESGNDKLNSMDNIRESEDDGWKMEDNSEETEPLDLKETEHVFSSEETESEFLIADSNVRYLTEEELSKYSAEQLRLIRNEIYARKGRKFKDEELQKYFNSKSWYHPTIEPDDFRDDTMLNTVERANTKMILKIENEKK